MAHKYKLQVQFRGWLDNQSDELRDLYERSTIFVFVSEVENFPIVLLEAMSAGLAIISTNGTGNGEVLGEAALMVQPRDPASIQTALLKMLHHEDTRSQLSRLARARVEQSFGWDKIADRYTTVYEEWVMKGK